MKQGSNLTHAMIRTFAQVEGCNAIIATETIANLIKDGKEQDFESVYDEFMVRLDKMDQGIRWGLFGLDRSFSQHHIDDNGMYHQPTVAKVRYCDLCSVVLIILYAMFSYWRCGLFILLS